MPVDFGWDADEVWVKAHIDSLALLRAKGKARMTLVRLALRSNRPAPGQPKEEQDNDATGGYEMIEEEVCRQIKLPVYRRRSLLQPPGQEW